MFVNNISLIGWLHSVTCVVALLTGAWNFLMPKGTATHRRMGRWYVYSMIVANLSVFAIYHFDISHFRPLLAGAHIFGIFHWEAVVTLIALALGFYAAPRQERAVWAYTHPLAMLLTYYMLIGALINESFARILPLRALVLAQTHGPNGFFGSRIVAMAQSAAMLFFIVQIFYFIVRTALNRRGRRKSAALGAA